MYSDPIAYFITFTGYGTWLPGDERGWTKWHKGDQVPQPFLADWCRQQMTETPCFFDENQRQLVEATIHSHCEIRNWRLHAVNCRTNHVHVVVTARDYDGEQVRDQFKAWCTRKLKEADGRKPAGAEVKADGRKPAGAEPAATPQRKHWWTEKGSVRYLFDDESLQAAIIYALEAQDAGGSKGG